MSLRLKRHGGTLVVATLVAVMLAAMMLGLFPAVAEAQTEGTNTSTMVVRPGDSLWSKSEERLGPDATPQRTLNAVEQIYALNRERIGVDSDLIFVGQELLVPSAMSSERLTGATTPAHKTTEAAEVGPRDRAAKSTMARAPRAASGGIEGVEASETVARRGAGTVNLPGEAAAPPVPAVRTVASNDARFWSSVASFPRTIRTGLASAPSALTEPLFESFADTRAEGRLLLGLGVLMLTLVVTGLMAWRLPTRRTSRRDAKRRGPSAGYYYDQAPLEYRTSPFAYHPGGSMGDRGEQDAQREASGALGRWRRAPKARAKARAKAGAVPRNGLTFGMYDPRIRRTSLRTPVPLGARKPRSRRRASFASGARS